MRPGYPQQQFGDRQADGQQDAVENAECQDPGGCCQGQQALVAAEREQPPERLDVDQPDRREDDDRASAQPLELPWTRERIRTEFTGGAYPQMLLRLGYGGHLAATPRRPVADTLIIKGD